jgi:hypothetical protein
MTLCGGLNLRQSDLPLLVVDYIYKSRNLVARFWIIIVRQRWMSKACDQEERRRTQVQLNENAERAGGFNLAAHLDSDSDLRSGSLPIVIAHFFHLRVCYHPREEKTAIAGTKENLPLRREETRRQKISGFSLRVFASSVFFNARDAVTRVSSPL